MKILLATVLLWSGMFMTQLQAQKTIEFIGDSLNIYNRNEIYARVICKNVHQLHNENQLQELLTSFFDHLESVKDQIPEYLNSQIIYIAGTSLKVEEISGIQKYRVDNKDLTPAFNQNIAYLTNGKLHIFLYFDKLESLLNQGYSLTISNAINKIGDGKKVKKFYNRGYYGSYNYSYSEDRLLERNNGKKLGRSYTFIGSGSLGLYKDRPIYEINLGLGFYIGKRKRNLIFISNNRLYQYDKERDRMQEANMLELGLYSHSLVSFKLAFPYSRNTVLNNIDYRVSTYVYYRKSFSLGFQFYHDISASKVFPGVTIGVGI